MKLKVRTQHNIRMYRLYTTVTAIEATVTKAKWVKVLSSTNDASIMWQLKMPATGS